MTPRDVIPVNWLSYLRDGPLTFGLDIATTEKKTSNPSSLVVSEKWQGLFIERLVVAWKTKDEEVTLAILAIMFADVASVGKKFRRGCLDASTEAFFAQTVKKQFAKYCPIHLIKGGEKLKFGMQEFDAKTLLGSLYVSAYTDGKIAIPNAPFIKDDRRLVKREKGRFECDLGRDGEHGDTLDAGKLAHWGQLRAGGRAEATAANTSSGETLPTQQRDRLGELHHDDRYETASINC